MNIFESLATFSLNGFSGKVVTDEANKSFLFYKGELCPITIHKSEDFRYESSYNYGNSSIVYDDIKIYSRKFTITKNGEAKTLVKYGFINKDGYAFTPAIFHKVYAFCNGIANVYLTSNLRLSGTIDINGNPIVKGHTLKFCSFAQGLFTNFGKCFKNGKWGVVNKFGYNVIPCEFDWVSLISPRTKHCYGEVNPTDTLYLSRNNSWYTAFIQGNSICNIRKGLFEVVSKNEMQDILVLAEYEDSGTMDFIGNIVSNLGGEYIIDDKYTKYEVLSKNYFAGYNGESWDIFYIEDNHKPEKIFNDITSFSFGHTIRNNETLYYIVVDYNTGGVSLFELDGIQHYEIKYLKEGSIYFDCPKWDFEKDTIGINDVFALKYSDYTEIINLNGDVISKNPISNNFELITSSYGEGLIGFKQTEYPFKRGYIDLTGRVVVQPKYSSVRAFKDGTALVYSPCSGCTINKDGKVIHSFLTKDDECYSDNESWKEQLGDAFDGQADAYWNID